MNYNEESQLRCCKRDEGLVLQSMGHHRNKAGKYLIESYSRLKLPKDLQEREDRKRERGDEEEHLVALAPQAIDRHHFLLVQMLQSYLAYLFVHARARVMLKLLPWVMK